jgi:hypothetical protein
MTSHNMTSSITGTPSAENLEASEITTLANRFRDIKDPMSIENVQSMISGIRLVDNVMHNIPDRMRAELHLYFYHLLKDNQDKLRSLDEKFTTIVQDKVQQALIALGEKEKAEREREKQKSVGMQ